MCALDVCISLARATTTTLRVDTTTHDHNRASHKQHTQLITTAQQRDKAKITNTTTIHQRITKTKTLTQTPKTDSQLKLTDRVCSPGLEKSLS